jgi:hypothetical protein
MPINWLVITIRFQFHWRLWGEEDDGIDSHHNDKVVGSKAVFRIHGLINMGKKILTKPQGWQKFKYQK